MTIRTCCLRRWRRANRSGARPHLIAVTRDYQCILSLFNLSVNFLYMDPIRNPFSPGAGSPPPELAGRGPLLEQARINLARVKAGRSERSFLLIGLRGVGKT